MKRLGFAALYIDGNRRSKNRFRSGTAFTLVEMMVAVGIIAILATLLFPAALRSRDRARRRRAMAEACSLAIAIKVYQTEYGKWPNQSQDNFDTTYFTDNWKVVDILRKPDHPDNHRDRIYLSIQESSLDEHGNYIDPWGWPYIICMDEDGNKKLQMSVTNVTYSNEHVGIDDYSFAEQADTISGVMAASVGCEDGKRMFASWDEIK